MMTIEEKSHAAIMENSLRRIADHMENQNAKFPLVIEFTNTEGETITEGFTRCCKINPEGFGTRLFYLVNKESVSEATYNSVRKIVNETYGIKGVV